MIIETNSEKETFELGKKIGENAKAGQIYTLTGDLGVGKTVFYTGACSRAWHHRAGKQPDLYDRADVRRRSSAVLSF